MLTEHRTKLVRTLDNPIPTRIQSTSLGFKNLNCDGREIQLLMVSP